MTSQSLLALETKQKLVLLAADVVGLLAKDDLEGAHKVAANLTTLLKEAHDATTRPKPDPKCAICTALGAYCYNKMHGRYTND